MTSQLKKEPSSGSEQVFAAFTGDTLSGTSYSSTEQAKASIRKRLTRMSGSVGERYVHPSSPCSQLNNIDELYLPNTDGTGANNMSEEIELCQKAYIHVPAFKNAVDVFTEFANSNVYFTGSNAKSRKFFEAWWKRINGWSLGDQFFREWSRSSTVILYRFDGKVEQDELRRINQVYGTSVASAEKIKIPVRYMMINPADIRPSGGSVFGGNNYYRVVTEAQRKALINPSGQNDIDFMESLDKDTRDTLLKSKNGALLPLSSDKIYTIFARKQDYESFPTPMFYSVLKDINLKMEFKKADAVAARALEYLILLVKVGDKDNPTTSKQIEFLSGLFSSEQVSRVLVADYTTQMEYVIPDINKILGPEKYVQVDKDIKEGLTNVFFGDDQFSSMTVKVKVFIERLNEARNAFLANFLQPEIKRVAKSLGMKSYPQAHFTKINLSDEAVWGRIYAQLMQLGVLTPEEGIEALQNNRLPSWDSSLESQRKFKEYREEGLFEPVMPGQREKQPEGRPRGTTGIPQTTKNVQPVGNSSAKISIASLQELFKKSLSLEETLEQSLKSKHKVKRLKADQKSLIADFAQIVRTNEPPEFWEAKAVDYLNSYHAINAENSAKISKLAAEYEVDENTATLIFWSQKEK